MISEQLLTQVQSLLQATGSQEQLTISTTTFQSANITSLLNTYYDGNAIVLQNASVQSTDTSTNMVSISGTTSFMNIEHAAVRVSLQETDAGVEMIVKYTLPPTWKFSQSFPTLPVSWDPRQPAGSPQYSLLDTLVYTDACLVVTSTPYSDPDYGVQLDTGLNFVSHSKLNGILGTIEQLLQVSGSVTLAGPIILPTLVAPTQAPTIPWPPTRTSTPRTGINLQAELHSSLALEQVTLTDTFLRVYSPPSTDWYRSNPLYPPTLFFGGDLHIGDDVTVEVLAEKFLGVDQELAFIASIEELKLPNLSKIAQLVGADDLESHLLPPAPAPSFFVQGSPIGVQSIIVTVTTKPFHVDAVALAFGLENMKWQAIDGVIEVDDLAARFTVNDPFSAQRALDVVLIGTMLIDSVPLTIAASAPNFTIGAWLTEKGSLPLKTLMKTYLPSVPAVSDLTIDEFYLEVTPGQNIRIVATLADQPQPWTIDLGPTQLAVSNVHLQLTYTKGSGFSGSIGGAIAIAGVILQANYQFPGPITLRGQFPAISLKSLITSLDQSANIWPAGFDLALSGAHVLIQEQAAGFEFLLGTQVDNIGAVALQIGQTNGQWSSTFGIDLDSHWKLSNLSATLAPFDTSFSFNKTLLLFSSSTSPNVTLPDMAVFNDPSLVQSKFVVPSSSQGIVKGFNFFAEIAFGGRKDLDLLKTLLHLDQATLDVLLQIGEDPLNSRLTANVAGRINETTTFDGGIRVILNQGNVVVSAFGDAHVTVHNRPLIFTGEFDINELGALFAATMQGSWTDAFDVRQLTLSDMAIQIGVDWEGIPTIGLAATVDIGDKQGSVAVLFDSQDPAMSMLAGSISDLTLTDVSHLFLDAVASIPSDVAVLLDQMTLKSIPLFTIPATLAADLDKASLSPAIIQAFMQGGKIDLSGGDKQALLVVGKPGGTWYLTDRKAVKHYTIAMQGDQLQVSSQVQLAIVPQTTSIGQLTFQQGISFAAQAQFLELDATVSADVHMQGGIAADGTMKPLDLGAVFRLSGPGGQGAPVISLATYDAPTSAYRGPHCVVSGGVTMLGFTRDLDLRATSDGITLTTDAKIFNVFMASLSAKCPLKNFKQGDFAVTAIMENDLFNFLQKRGVAAIKQSVSSASSAIADAQKKVAAAQQQVNILNSQIAQETAQIQQERQNAANTLNAKQNEVNSLQNQINSTQQSIDSLNNEVNSLEDDVRHHPWNFAKDGVLITAKKSEVAGLEAEKVSLQGSLATATQALSLLRSTVVSTPIELDPRVSSLYASLKTATLTLEAAQASLQQVEQSYGKLANAATWIAQHSDAELLIITHAQFSGKLSAVSGGQVTMAIDGTLMSHPFHIDQGFNFHDVETTAKKFADSLKQYI